MSLFDDSKALVEQAILKSQELEGLLRKIEQGIKKSDEEIRKCDELLNDALHLSEFFEDQNPDLDEYVAIGHTITRLRTKRREAKMSKYVLEANRKAVGGLLPAVVFANTRFEEPAERGKPSYNAYRLRNEESHNLIDQLPSFDMNHPVRIITEKNVPIETTPEEPQSEAIPENEKFLPVEKKVPIKNEEEEPQSEAVSEDEKKVPISSSQPQPAPLVVVQKQGQSYVIIIDNEVVTRTTNFVDLILKLIEEFEDHEYRFEGRTYRSLSNFATNFRRGKQRGSDAINPMKFERLYSAAYF